MSINNLLNELKSFYFIIMNRWGSSLRYIYNSLLYSDFIPDLVISSSGLCDVKLPICNAYENENNERSYDSYLWQIERLRSLADKSTKRIAVLPFAPCIKIETVLRPNDILLSNSYAIHLICESKKKLFHHLYNANVDASLIPSSILLCNNIVHEDIVKKIGLPYIIQSESSGGKGTKIVRNERDLHSETVLKSYVKATEFIEGRTYNFVLLTIPRANGTCDVYVDTPSYKPHNIDLLAGNKYSSSGNFFNYTQFYKSKMIIDNLVKLGKYLYEKYDQKGLWGVDIIYYDGNYHIIEINSRIQGTTEMSTVGALYRKIVPHYISHIAVFLNFNVDWLPDCGEYNMQTSKFMESNILPVYFYLKFKYMYDIFFKSKNTVESVCPINNNILEYYEKGYYTLAHIPNNNTIVRKGLELCILEGFNLPRKLILKDNLISNESVLSDYGYNLIKKIYNSFRVGEL